MQVNGSQKNSFVTNIFQHIYFYVPQNCHFVVNYFFQETGILTGRTFISRAIPLENTTFPLPLHDTTQIHQSLRTHSQTSCETKNFFFERSQKCDRKQELHPTVTICCKLMEDILACSKRAVSFLQLNRTKKLLYSLSGVFSIAFSCKLWNTINYTSSKQRGLTY